jgi:DNA-binding CsgD family transcriptional regulator
MVRYRPAALLENSHVVLVIPVVQYLSQHVRVCTRRDLDKEVSADRRATDPQPPLQAILERLGAAREADAAARLLRGLGVAGRTGPKGEGSLTKRETEILRLVAEGLSNAQIAQRLYLSRRTVENHVAHVLTKLGLTSRTQAVAYAMRHLLSQSS